MNSILWPPPVLELAADEVGFVAHPKVLNHDLMLMNRSVAGITDREEVTTLVLAPLRSEDDMVRL